MSPGSCGIEPDSIQPFILEDRLILGTMTQVLLWGGICFFFCGGAFSYLAPNAPTPSSAASLGMVSMCSCTIGMTVMAPAFVVGGLGPKVGGDQVWAYHPSSSATTPPKTGWKVGRCARVGNHLSFKRMPRFTELKSLIAISLRITTLSRRRLRCLEGKWVFTANDVKYDPHVISILSRLSAVHPTISSCRPDRCLMMVQWIAPFWSAPPAARAQCLRCLPLQRPSHLVCFTRYQMVHGTGAGQFSETRHLYCLNPVKLGSFNPISLSCHLPWQSVAQPLANIEVRLVPVQPAIFTGAIHQAEAAGDHAATEAQHIGHGLIRS